jgi:ATP-binding cassette subfamily B protein
VAETPPPASGAPGPAAEKPGVRNRLAALANIPPALRLLASAAPTLISALVVCRLVTAFLPFGTLLVSKHLIDLVVIVTEQHAPAPTRFVWLLLGAGFGLAATSLVIGRLTDFLEARLGDEFSRAISLRVLQHAASLDLQAFEDATFYDMLERAPRPPIGRNSSRRSGPPCSAS